MRIISRSEWGAKPWRGAVYKVAPKKRTHFFVHYHGGPVTRQVGVSVPRDVEVIHLANGWSGTGYGHMVDMAGAVYEGRGFDVVGAHCPGWNTLGFSCYVAVGGSQKPTPDALHAVRNVYEEACRLAGRSLIPTTHGTHYPTECCGPVLTPWVKAGMPRPGGGMPPAARPQRKDNSVTLTQLEIDAIARGVADMVMGAGARYPVVVDPGTGQRKLSDGRDADSLPTVLGELQSEAREHYRAAEAALRRIEAAVTRGG